jgi:hypothetical protein
VTEPVWEQIAGYEAIPGGNQLVNYLEIETSGPYFYRAKAWLQGFTA